MTPSPFTSALSLSFGNDRLAVSHDSLDTAGLLDDLQLCGDQGGLFDIQCFGDKDLLETGLHALENETLFFFEDADDNLEDTRDAA
jgi:hypothetical protein